MHNLVFSIVLETYIKTFSNVCLVFVFTTVCIFVRRGHEVVFNFLSAYLSLYFIMYLCKQRAVRGIEDRDRL